MKKTKRGDQHRAPKTSRSFGLPQVLAVVSIVFLLGTIVPPLLEASSDISVLIGVCVVVSIFYSVIVWGREILTWLGFDI